MTLFGSRRIPGWLVLVGAMSALGPFSIDMYLPAFPQIEREFAERGVEATMAAYMFGIALGQLVYGPVSDRFGRKPPLYVGLIMYAFGALGCALASTMSMLTSMRVLQAVGACAPLVIGRAIVRDRCEPQEAAQAYSVLMVIVSLGPVIAPTLGAWMMMLVGWRSVFVFQALGGIVLLVAVHLAMAESLDPALRQPLRLGAALGSYVRLLRDRQFLGYSLVGGFAMSGLFGFIVGSPIVMAEQYGLTPQQFGWMIALNGVAFLSASRWNIASLQHTTPDRVLARAIWFPILITLALAIASLLVHVPLWLVILAQFGYFLSVGRTGPNVSALALAPHARRAGAASALLGAVQSGLGMLAGIAVGALVDDTLFRLAALMAATAALALASYYAIARSYRAATLVEDEV